MSSPPPGAGNRDGGRGSPISGRITVGAGDPAAIVATLARQLAPGSYVAISHLTADLAPGPVTAGVAAYNTQVPTGVTARTHSQVTALFAGLPLVLPGVVPLTEWRPTHASAPPTPVDLYAGLARVPGGRM